MIPITSPSRAENQRADGEGCAVSIRHSSSNAVSRETVDIYLEASLWTRSARGRVCLMPTSAASSLAHIAKVWRQNEDNALAVSQARGIRYLFDNNHPVDEVG